MRAQDDDHRLGEDHRDGLHILSTSGVYGHPSRGADDAPRDRDTTQEVP
jgi:hypothetical protein